MAAPKGALDLVRAMRPDAAVLDINLFGETVRPVADALSKLGVPFVFCTGHHGPANVGNRHTRVPVLHKAVNSNDLIIAVGHLFVRKRDRDAMAAG